MQRKQCGWVRHFGRLGYVERWVFGHSLFVYRRQEHKQQRSHCWKCQREFQFIRKYDWNFFIFLFFFLFCFFFKYYFHSFKEAIRLKFEIADSRMPGVISICRRCINNKGKALKRRFIRSNDFDEILSKYE